jgi:hypothetical protein
LSRHAQRHYHCARPYHREHQGPRRGLPGSRYLGLYAPARADRRRQRPRLTFGRIAKARGGSARLGPCPSVCFRTGEGGRGRIEEGRHATDAPALVMTPRAKPQPGERSVAIGRRGDEGAPWAKQPERPINALTLALTARC